MLIHYLKVFIKHKRGVKSYIKLLVKLLLHVIIKFLIFCVIKYDAKIISIYINDIYIMYLS